MSTTNKLDRYTRCPVLPSGSPQIARRPSLALQKRQISPPSVAIQCGSAGKTASAARCPRPWTISAALIATVVGWLVYALPPERGIGTSAANLHLTATPFDLEVRQGLEGETSYVALTLYDSHDEDGDVIELSLPGGSPFSSFVLTSQGHRVLIPITATGTAVIRVKAVHDGSQIDKVSFGAKTSAANVSSRIMAEGETQTITLTVAR